MEQLSNNKPSHEIENQRNEAIRLASVILAEKNGYLEDITKMVQENDVLRKAANAYGGGRIGEILADFKVLPWGDLGNPFLLEELVGVINANPNQPPSLEALNKINGELTGRTESIKKTLTNFSGTQDEAENLLSSLMKENVLKPLNDVGERLLG